MHAGVHVVPAAGVTVLSLLRRDYVIITTSALTELVERLRRPINRLGAAGKAYRQQLAARRAAEAAERVQQQLLAQLQPVQLPVAAGGDVERAAEALQQAARAVA